jgi:dipeptidyl aminopeptidase/acylaminoacyl peptidase
VSGPAVALVVAGTVYLVIIGFSARLGLKPGRSRPWSTPEEVGLEYEDVEFEAWDGVRLRGWFMPAAPTGDGPSPTIVSLHGWPWSRMGTQANSLLNDLPGSRPINLLPFFRDLHQAGYSVLAFDIRNFGESDGRGVFTVGWQESRDLRGALDWLARRPDVDVDRLGVIGFSNGGNTLVFALPWLDIRAGIAVQPTTGRVFQRGYSRALFGPLAPVVNWGVNLLTRLSGSPAYRYIDTADSARGARDIPVLFVQGTGDKWSTQEDVARVAAATPRGSTLFPTTDHRFGGYRHILENPQISISFFHRHVKGEILDEPLKGEINLDEHVTGEST